MAKPIHIMIVATECEAGHEAEFHEWYDTVHIPDLLAIPGIVSAKRFESTVDDGSNRWLCVYELDDDIEAVQARLASADFYRSPYYLRGRTISNYYSAYTG